MSSQDEVAAVLVDWIREQRGSTVNSDLDLFDSGTLDSFGFIELIEMIEEVFATTFQIDALNAPEARTVAGLALLVVKGTHGE